MEQHKLIIAQAEKFVQDELGTDRSGHDWWHIHRVRNAAVTIAQHEQADVFICELAALLHDISDEKLNESKEAGEAKLRTWMEHHIEDQAIRNQVMGIISTMSYNGGKNPPMSTLEGKIVQDADRLDAIGAIGIARTFAYGGSKGRSMHEPERDLTGIEYRSEDNTSIYHFYEKLLKLKSLMNTDHAKKIADSRHAFMEQFLDQFYKEWEAQA